MKEYPISSEMVSVFCTENFDSYEAEQFVKSMTKIGLSVVGMVNGEAYEFVISHEPLTDDELCDFMRNYYENDDLDNDSILESVIEFKGIKSI